MALSFNLQEYILFRTEIKRELTNAEVDTNFQMVSNPWVTTRLYEEGNIVYHPVIVDDPATTGEDQVLAWWRANKRTTQGTFVTSEWDIIGGLGSGNINVQGANSFGKIRVNSTAATGALQNGNNALVESVIPNDTFNFIAGQGMELQYNLSSKSIVLINSLAANPGEVNAGQNIGQGVTQQPIYYGKSGVNLQFRGLDVSNTSGNALSVSTNTVQDNVVYNFNEGLVSLTNIDNGQPLIEQLYNVSTNPPTNNQILQWNQSLTPPQWVPVDISVVGTQNIYTTDGIITSGARTVQLSGSGPLSFNNPSNPGTGVNINGNLITNQLSIKADLINRDSAIAFTNSANGTNFTIGMDATDNSFGIAKNLGLQGLSVDALSISTNSELYVPQLASDSLDVANIGFRIPLVEFSGGSAEIGRFGSSPNYIASTFTSQSGLTGRLQIQHGGYYALQGFNNGTSPISTAFTNLTNHDFSGTLTTGFSSQENYSTGGSSIQSSNYSNWVDKNDSRLIVNHKASTQHTGTAPTGVPYTKVIGSNIILDNKTGLAINVGEVISFSDFATATAPQRVGIYSNVVDTQTVNDGETILTSLIADSNTWAGYFVGCVNIEKGGLVLPSSATKPVCTDVSGNTIPDRTLWINSANGHLYRGDVDVEVTGALSLGQLSDVNLTTPVQPNQILAYDFANSEWDNVTLAPYNLNAIQLATGGNATIRLSDGSGSSDIDLIPGAGIDLVVDEALDTITISATGGGGGGGGAQGAQGTTGAQGATGGAQGAQGVQGVNGAGAQGAQGADPIADALIITVQNVGGNKYFVDGVQQTTLQFYQGFTYTFDQTDSTNSTHPIAVSTTQDGTNNGGVQYTNGWTTNGGSAGSTLISTFKVPQNAPSILYYYCQNHPNMGGQLNVGTVAGSLGAQGAQGATGAGVQGAQGTAGSQGATGGAQGAQGVQGTAGAQGNQGDSGAQGAQGIQGDGGSQGAQGVQGIQGTAGAQGNQGDSGAQGNQGATGAQGNQGAQGIQGVQGTTGTGAQGSTGNQGTQGTAGAQGNQGAQGTTGTGAQGSTGNQGDTGAQGAQGVQGATGTGAQGSTGNQGAQGVQGVQGNTGNQGAQGVQGATGNQGSGGAQGNQGAAGAQGAQGVQGSPGVAQTGNVAGGGQIDIDNVVGFYYNMASATSTTAFAITPSATTVGGFARILFNTTSQPTVTGNSATLIKGDPWITGTNMYLTVQYNGNRAEYFFEQI